MMTINIFFHERQRIQLATILLIVAFIDVAVCTYVVVKGWFVHLSMKTAIYAIYLVWWSIRRIGRCQVPGRKALPRCILVWLIPITIEFRFEVFLEITYRDLNLFIQRDKIIEKMTLTLQLNLISYEFRKTRMKSFVKVWKSSLLI